MASNPVIKGIELGDMDNMYTMYTSPKKPDPPEGFIDNTVYRYRLKPDGTKEFIGTMPPFPEGWDDPAKRKMTRNLRQQKNIEEEEGMRAVSLDKEKMVAKARELMSQGRSMNKAAQELGVPIGTLAYWLKKDKEQTPEPKPAEAGNQEPVQESQEPAGDSVAQEEPEITVKDVLMCEAAQREQGFGPEDDEPIPYQVAEDATLDEMKVIWIENVLTHCTQAKTQLQYIQAIMDLRV